MKNSKIEVKVLFLGSEASPVFSFLRQGYHAFAVQEPLDNWADLIQSCEVAICFGYRHVLKPEILQKFKRPVINLHISFLPYNRGADPNLWSFLEKTPSGVTIHEMDKGIDTGPILIQKKIHQDLQKETLKSSYEKLCYEICRLFVLEFSAILAGKRKAVGQLGTGSFHALRDKEKYLHLLHSGWDTQVKDIWGAACKDPKKISKINE